MNNIIEQANKDLAAIFGLCLHEYLTATSPCMHCKYEKPRDVPGWAIKDFNIDFRDGVDIPCSECEGKGCAPKSRDDYCLSCDLNTDAQCNFFIECPSCNGIGSRLITELQMHAEKDDTWLKFMWSITYLSDPKRSFFVVTDINQLLIKYRDWRQKHEAQKT